MSKQRSSNNVLGDLLTFAGYVKVSSGQPLADCVLALREQPHQAVWFGGYNTRLLFPKTNAQNNIPFEIEYYRQRRRSSRSSHMVQRMRGVLFSENGQTHLVAKASFTGAGVLWLWLGILLTLVSVGLLLYTGNIVMWALIGMVGAFTLAMVGVMWLDRYHLTKLVRKSMGKP